MGKAQQGSDALSFQSYVNQTLDDRDRIILNEMIAEYRKKNHDPLFYLSRIAILSDHRTLRDAFERETNQIINQMERDHGR
jgi:hypothetical protein